MPFFNYGQSVVSAKQSDNSTYKYIIGIKIISSNSYDKSTLLPQDFKFLNGLCFKYSFIKNFSLRNFLEWHFFSHQDFDYKGYLDSKLQNEIILKSGIEMSFGKNKTVLFLALDFSYQYYQRKEIWHIYSNPYLNEYESIGYHNHRSNIFGIEPVAGLSYMPNNRLTISLESSLLYSLYWSKLSFYSIGFANSNLTPSYSSPAFLKSKNELSFNPLRRLILTYSFGKRK